MHIYTLTQIPHESVCLCSLLMIHLSYYYHEFTFCIRIHMRMDHSKQIYKQTVQYSYYEINISTADEVLAEAYKCLSARCSYHTATGIL